MDKNPSACLQLANIAKMILKRNLTQFESDMMMFPRMCGHCSTFLGSVDHEVCQGCHVALYCDKQCQESDKDHVKNCQQFRENREDYIHSLKTTSCGNMPSMTQIHHHPKTMSDALKVMNLSLESSEGRRISSMLSSPLTCLSALVNHTNLSSASCITVHLVGSRKIETSSLWSLLLSLSPSIERISLIFIGLECIESSQDELSRLDTRITMEFVPPCSYEEYSTSDSFKVDINKQLPR